MKISFLDNKMHPTSWADMQHIKWLLRSGRISENQYLEMVAEFYDNNKNAKSQLIQHLTSEAMRKINGKSNNYLGQIKRKARSIMESINASI